MRDYAIQHLVLWCAQGAPDGSEAKTSIGAVLKEAAGQSDAIAGTALLGLHRLSSDGVRFDPAEINLCALRLALSAGTDKLARLTAIQVCAERGLKAVVPTIEPLVNTPDCVPLGLSAAAAVRRLGGSQHTDVALRTTRGPVE